MPKLFKKINQQFSTECGSTPKPTDQSDLIIYINNKSVEYLEQFE